MDKQQEAINFFKRKIVSDPYSADIYRMAIDALEQIGRLKIMAQRIVDNDIDKECELCNYTVADAENTKN